MKKNTKLSLTISYIIRYIITGVLWLAHALLKVLGKGAGGLMVASRVCMIAAVMTLLASIVLPAEQPDDITTADFNSACKITLAIMMFALMIISLLAEFGKLGSMPFTMIYPFVIGTGLLLIGVIFFVIEKVC